MHTCAGTARVGARGQDRDSFQSIPYTTGNRDHCGHQPLSMKCDLTTIAAIFPGFFLLWISHCMFVEEVLSGRNLASHSCQWCELTKWQKLSLLEASTWKITETEHTVKQSGLDCDCGKWISDKKEKDFEIAVTVALMDDQVHRIGYANQARRRAFADLEQFFEPDPLMRDFVWWRNACKT